MRLCSDTQFVTLLKEEKHHSIKFYCIFKVLKLICNKIQFTLLKQLKLFGSS